MEIEQFWCDQMVCNHHYTDRENSGPMIRAGVGHEPPFAVDNNEQHSRQQKQSKSSQ
jgi:hypothetical protein